VTVFHPADVDADEIEPVARDIAIEIRGVKKRFRRLNDRKTNVKELFSSRRTRTKRYDDFWALKGIDIDIPRGKTFGLIGHNGSGKSTLLKLVAGIHRPTEGTIVHHGRISAMLELGAGFHPEMSGRDNIYLNGSILGMTRKQIDAAMDKIIAFSGLEEFIDTPVKVYSSGMYVRLGFAIAVNLEPEILIVDEVIAVGDEEFQRRCFDHLYELRRRGVTIVLGRTRWPWWPTCATRRPGWTGEPSRPSGRRGTSSTSTSRPSTAARRMRAPTGKRRGPRRARARHPVAAPERSA